MNLRIRYPFAQIIFRFEPRLLIISKIKVALAEPITKVTYKGQNTQMLYHVLSVAA